MAAVKYESFRIDAVTACKYGHKLVDYANCMIGWQQTRDGDQLPLAAPGCATRAKSSLVPGVWRLTGCCDDRRASDHRFRGISTQAEAAALPACSFLPPKPLRSNHRLIQ